MKTKEDFISVEEGVRLFYRKVGQGTNAVIIPNGLYFYDEFERFADSHTLIFYDVRNRGFSDTITNSKKLALGIHQDVEDLETFRKQLGIDRVDLIGHSYIGLMVGLYAKKYPAHVNRMVQIGATQPDAGKQYPAHLTGADATLTEVFSKIAQMQKEKGPEDPVEACRRFWSVLRTIYVADPGNAEKIHWGRCELPNERNFMKYWTEIIFPSMQGIHLTAEQLTDVKAPVLVVHGVKDRITPIGGARDWASLFTNARLLTVPNAGHAPWIEAPELVLNAIGDFLDGKWPEAAEHVDVADTENP